MSKEKKAVIMASITAIILIILKTTFAIMTGSMAILTSAIDSALDFIVSIMNFFAIKKSEEPHDDDHHYGHGKIEGFGALFEGIIIFISGGIVIYTSIHKIIEKDFMKLASESVIAMVLCMAITWMLVTYLTRIAKETQSLVVKADSLHYKSDLYTNAGIIIALIILAIFRLPIIDPIIGILIAFYIMYGSIEIIREGFDMLMDKRIDSEDINHIVNSISKFGEVSSYHFLKTRKSGKNKFIEFHIVFKDIEISLKKAHMTGDEIENLIIEKIPHSHITIHLDYYDDSINTANPKIKEVGVDIL